MPKAEGQVIDAGKTAPAPEKLIAPADAGK
jgi:hypothetical protein